MQIAFSCFIFLLFLVSFSLKAQVGKPFIHNYTSKEYKAHVQNWSLTQDNRGVIYIGNGDGILEFDGNSWQIIPITKNKGTGFSMFYSDFSNKNQQKVYVGATNEFGYLHPTTQGYLEYTSLTELLDSIPQFDRILKIVQQKTETNNEVIFYAPTLRKIFILEDDGQSTKLDTLSYNAYQVIFNVNQKAYFWDFTKGMHKIENKKFIPVLANSFYQNHIIDFVLEETENSLLICAREYTRSEEGRLLIINRKLYRVSTSQFETSQPKDISEEYTEFLNLLQKINYSYGIYNKVVRLPSNEIAILDVRSGIYILNEKGVLQQKVVESTGLLTNAIYDMTVTDKGNLFVAMNKGVAHVETASPISFWDKNSGLDGVVEAMYYFEGRIYVATHQGLYYLDGDKAKRVIGDTPLSTQTWAFTRFTPVSEEKVAQKEILLVSDNNGLHQLIDSTAKRIFINQDNVFDFYQSPKSPNRIFLLTGSGVNAIRYENGKWKNEGQIKELNDDVRMMAEDKNGNLWLGTFRNGAIKIPYYENPEEITANKIKYYTEEQGFLSLKNVLVYPFGDDVVFATEKGLYKYDETTDKMILAPELENTSLTDASRDIFSFTESSNGDLWYAGLQSATGSIGIAKKQADGSYQLYETPFKKIHEMMVLAHYLAPDGTMWFGGSEGVFRYDPKRDTDYYKARNILIRKVQVGKDSVVYGGFTQKYLINKNPSYQIISLDEDLPYDLNSITFEFSLPNFGEGKSKYRYRLKGFSDEWSEWTTDSKAIYTNLFEGEYTFEVEGKNSYERISNIAGYSFHIEPPIYRTWFAFILYALLAIGVVWFAVKWNGRRLEKEKENLEAIVQQRTAEIQQQKEEIEQQANNVMLANAEINQQKEEIEAQAESLREANLSITEQNQEISLQKDEVEKSYKNIQILSEIGQKITQILNQNDLVKTVYSNVNALMPAEFFGIGLYNPQLQRIEFSGFIENNEEMPFHYDRLEEKDSKSVICFTQQKELIENNFLTDLQKMQEEKGEKFVTKVGQIPQSFVYLPLFVENKPVGVITVQSLEKDAYKEQQLTILRTLAAYTSIALDNVSAYQMIEEKNRNITDSIRYANTIQGAVLPHQNEFAKLFTEHFILYNPKDIVSGDFYWLAQREGITYLAAIDCTGHGVPGAFMSMIGHSILTEIINEIPNAKPSEVLEEMNKRLVAALHQNQESNSDGMDMCLCAFHFKESENNSTVKIEYAGAKRALYYALPNLNSNTEKVELEIIPATRRSIGGKQYLEKPFENNEIQVPKGTTLYLTTDGYVDQNNPNGNKIGTLKFLDMIRQISDKLLAEQYLHLVDYLDNFQETTNQRDDITIIGIRI
ncbi:SpoIIE family protein phosphatase [Bernardetia sp. OM2101]|uniref:SpoIIE family protein phosphatase n=1 Tax=Bernardetia sp. OM2101 TaxID=3344876 RepID=UPI0035D07854